MVLVLVEVCIAFTIIREVASLNSPSGNHTIEILNYDTFAATFFNGLLEGFTMENS